MRSGSAASGTSLTADLFLHLPIAPAALGCDRVRKRDARMRKKGQFMSFFTRLFGGKKKQKAGELVNRAPAEKKDAAPTRSAPSAGDALNELRHQARTGDPKLTGTHRSGKF